MRYTCVNTVLTTENGNSRAQSENLSDEHDRIIGAKGVKDREPRKCPQENGDRRQAGGEPNRP